MSGIETEITKHLSMIDAFVLCRYVNTQSDAVFSNDSKVKLQGKLIFIQ